jgi:hypothetical protein
MEYVKRGQVGVDFTNQSTLNTPPTTPYQFEFSVSAEKLNEMKLHWDKYKVFNWDNFYPEHVAHSLHDYYYNMDKNEWDLALHPDPYYDYGFENTDPLIDDYYYLYLTKDNDPTIPEREAYAREVNFEGGFSYIYRRTNEFHPYLKWFSSPKFLKIVESITGYTDLEYKLNYNFVSCYEEGHYNGPHTDGDNGRVAMVLHLSKDWKPQYGGVFMRTDWDRLTVNKVVNPPFNTLTMFNVIGGAPHFVSEVVKGVKNKRIAYTGWYV